MSAAWATAATMSALVVMSAWSVSAVAGASVSSGPLGVRVAPDLGLLVTFADHGVAVAASPAVHLDGTLYGTPSMRCSQPAAAGHGTDSFGTFTSISINCSVGSAPTPVDYSIMAYDLGQSGRDGLVIFDVALPRGATGLRMRDFVAGVDRSPPQFAPFPSFDLDASPALQSPVALCYGSERPHMLASKGVAGMSSQCLTLSGGMSVLGWTSEQSPTSLAGAVITAANEFHLSLNRLQHPGTGHPGAATGSNASDGTHWSHGLSAEIDAVPPGFVGRTMLYYSSQGLNAAVDGWGTTLRQAYKTEKRDAEDVFLQTATLWTDNGAALNGEQWHTNASAPVALHGQYQQLNYSMVDQESIGAVADSISATGVSARGTQIDCWWYPTLLVSDLVSTSPPQQPTRDHHSPPPSCSPTPQPRSQPSSSPLSRAACARSALSKWSCVRARVLIFPGGAAAVVVLCSPIISFTAGSTGFCQRNSIRMAWRVCGSGSGRR
jgi:hypothetical protein